MRECLIRDAALASKIAAQLGLEVKALTIEALKRLEELDASELDLTSLEGLQYCKNLTILSLERNNVADISPLAGLIDLEVLSLTCNPVVDVSALKGLSALRHLYLGGTLVSDISFVRALPELRMLSVVFSRVTTLTDLYFSLVSNSNPRLEKVSVFGNDLDIASIAFVASLRNAGIEVRE